MPPPSSVNRNAITPAINATEIAPASIQATTATAPPVTSAPGNLPSTVCSTPPTTSARIMMTGRNDPIPRVPPERLSSGFGNGSPSITRRIRSTPAAMPP